MFLSTTEPLEDDGTVTLGPVTVDRIDTLAGYVKTDTAATVLVEQTGDGENWDVSESIAVVANTTKTFSVSLIASQVRIKVSQASGGDQTFLRLYARGTSAGDS
jgi:hypothetical protein